MMHQSHPLEIGSPGNDHFNEPNFHLPPIQQHLPDLCSDGDYDDDIEVC